MELNSARIGRAPSPRLFVALSEITEKVIRESENGGEKMVHVSGRFAAAAELNSATL